MGNDPKRFRPNMHCATVLAFASLATLWPAPALPTPAQGQTTENVAAGVYRPIDVKSKDGQWEVELKTDGTSHVHVVRNTFAPDGHSGWHTHPGPSLITVTEGEITVYEGDGLCSSNVYGVGDGSIDLGGGHVHRIANEGSVAAKTVVVQIIPKDAARRIDASKPSTCEE